MDISKLKEFASTKQFAVVSAAVVAGSSAAAISHILTRKHYRAKYEQIAEEEIAQAKVYFKDQYDLISKKEEFDTPEDALKHFGHRLEKEGYKESAEEAAAETQVDAEPVVTNNIFVDSKPISSDFDYDEEIAKRTEDEPYIITREEFLGDERGYDQLAVTYYEEDDILAAEDDSLIEDADDVVGEENLTRFGHGSKDNRVVYVRNEILEAEYEIVKSNGSWAKEVMGFDSSDAKPGVRKFRGDDG